MLDKLKQLFMELENDDPNDSEECEVDVIEMDGKDYIELAQFESEGNLYVYLANADDDDDFCIRKQVLIDGEEMLVGLEDEVRRAMILYATQILKSGIKF